MKNEEKSRTTFCSKDTVPRAMWWFLVVSLVAWPFGMYWMANHYSGWMILKGYYDAGTRPLVNNRGRTHVTLVQASGRRYDFGSHNSGQATHPRTEVGFDDEGFWIRGVYDGWTGGPVGAVYVPWTQVQRCDGLRVHLTFPDLAISVQDQTFLDACACQVKHICQATSTREIGK